MHGILCNEERQFRVRVKIAAKVHGCCQVTMGEAENSRRGDRWAKSVPLSRPHVSLYWKGFWEGESQNNMNRLNTAFVLSHVDGGVVLTHSYSCDPIHRSHTTTEIKYHTKMSTCKRWWRPVHVWTLTCQCLALITTVREKLSLGDPNEWFTG
jgi:hypothetical protein